MWFFFINHLVVSNVASFQLPDPKGQAGGALTSAMLKVLYKDHQNSGADLTFKDALLAIRAILKQGSYSQTPQLSSSRPMDIDTTFDLAPEKYTGTRRAVMIGYVGWYDVNDMRMNKVWRIIWPNSPSSLCCCAWFALLESITSDNRVNCRGK